MTVQAEMQAGGVNFSGMATRPWPTSLVDVAAGRREQRTRGIRMKGTTTVLAQSISAAGPRGSPTSLLQPYSVPVGEVDSQDQTGQASTQRVCS